MIKRNLKKGVTLFELTIVMALLAVVTVMVVSFSSLVRNNVQAITSENDVLSDFDKVKYVFDTWISTFDSEDYDFYNDEDKLYAVNNKNTSIRYQLMLTDDGILTGSVPIGTTGQSTVVYDGTGTLYDLEFSIRTNAQTGNILIDLRVSYIIYNVSGTKKETHKAHFLKATRASGMYLGF
ncbi:MAG: prepilin-type N-terminal cleavage/methylation domain-containing protein [Bacilli bacterium]|nr:prepilin-type N-terminal cleavage/methylation domain-containing protein [Bacilli bacterium]